MRKLFRQPFDDVLASLGHIMTVATPFKAFGPMLIAMVITWFVYVPIHELLHVLGCVAAGGSVSKLEVAPQYGGKILAEYFSFVVSGSDYAGQLTGFDTKGSDLIYLSTVFLPFVLTVLIGVPLVRLCTKRRRPMIFGMAIVVGLAPFYNMPGDYFEMGSILTTRFVTLIQGGGNPPAFEGIRSDDVFLLLKNVITQPAEVGLTSPGQIAIGILLIGVSLTVDILLAFITYAVGGAVAGALIGPAPAPSPARAPRPPNQP